MVVKTLVDSTPELTDAERERLFGQMDPDWQAQLADVVFQCDYEGRQVLYRELRGWWWEAAAEAGVRL
jgi:hypothetical protein